MHAAEVRRYGNLVTRRTVLNGVFGVACFVTTKRVALGATSRIECSAFNLSEKKAFVCDMDGTLFLGKKPIEPAIRFVTKRADKYRFYFLTNNTSKTPASCLAKLHEAGITVEEDAVLTPLITLIAYIQEKKYTSVYLVANTLVTSYLAERLPHVSFGYAPDKNQLVALTYDSEVNYEKLKQASILLNAKPPLDYVATHGDACCPSEAGPIPDIGGLIALIQTTNGRKPLHVFGKPSPSLLEPVLRRFEKKQIAVVGDRLYTDKAMADNAGVDFVCVLSGETTRESLKAYTGTPPSIVVETLGDLL